MTAKTNVFYTEEHEWIEVIDETRARVGISAYAVEQLGDVVYVEFLAEEDEEVDQGDEFASVESVKSVSEVYSPVAGTVVKTNEALDDEPETLNSDPLGAGWMVEIETSEAIDTSAWMDSKAYEDFVASL